MKPETTTYEVTITHYKPLPARVPLTDIIGQRLYSYCYSQGCEVGVKVKLAETKDEGDAASE